MTLIVIAVLAVLAAAVAGGFFWRSHVSDERVNEIARLSRRAADLDGRLGLSELARKKAEEHVVQLRDQILSERARQARVLDQCRAEVTKVYQAAATNADPERLRSMLGALMASPLPGGPPAIPQAKGAK